MIKRKIYFTDQADYKHLYVKTNINLEDPFHVDFEVNALI